MWIKRASRKQLFHEINNDIIFKILACIPPTSEHRCSVEYTEVPRSRELAQRILQVHDGNHSSYRERRVREQEWNCENARKTGTFNAGLQPTMEAL